MKIEAGTKIQAVEDRHGLVGKKVVAVGKAPDGSFFVFLEGDFALQVRGMGMARANVQDGGVN